MRTVLALLFLAGTAFAQERAPAGFQPLFNGRDLDGWRGQPHFSPYDLAALSAAERAERQAAWNADRDAHWRVEDGALVNDGAGVYLTTARDYGDFELQLEYRTVAGADSGIYLRGTPQVQIWDTTEAGGKWNIGADKGSGGLWNNQTHPRMPLVHADLPFGAWNQLRIRQVGARTSVWLNGQLTVDFAVMENYWNRELPLPARGPIQLQTHGGEIRWRGLTLREIGAEEANGILQEHGGGGFETVFNGRDLDGWQGPVDDYEVVDGAIQCKQGHGGTLHTVAEYGDFVARMEILLPPGGNNGLAIRYPGSGDTAYLGMCELQVLDDGAAQYANLKPWQYHGSAYGQVPAQRGYQRPTGTWNFQEVTVLGSRVRVELNGTVILDADLAAVETPPSGHEHPGRLRTRGYFGFAGHNDPVRYRNVRIRPMDG
ncbi:MAG TPA: DUF1080 domain-containing protein [Planctomycetota bacterium]